MTLDVEYEKACRLAQALRRDLHTRLALAIKRLGDPHLVRAVVHKPRTKKLESLQRKASEKGWTVTEAISKSCDFVGIRIVCNNLQDVKRVADLVQETIQQDGVKVQRIDLIRRPRRGYRALHLRFYPPVRLGAESLTIGCEVQIRTRLQDAWAELSHADVFKNESKLPRALVRKMERLAEALAKADKIAEQIRAQVCRPRRGRKPPAGAPMSASALAFIYKRAFGTDPPEYVVQSVLNDLHGLPVRAESLDQAVQDGRLREQLREAYFEGLPNEQIWEPEPWQLFQWGVHAGAQGVRSALATARREGREAWEEVERQYRSEIAAELPATWEDMRDQLQGPDADGDLEDDIHLWAGYFGASGRCVCGARLVDVYELADRVVRHYRLRGSKADSARELVTRGVLSAGVEDNENGVCSYCWQSLHED